MYEADIPLPLLRRGKTRDTFELPDPNLLLMVSTDRISTHHIVHKSIVPQKGQILTALMVFWVKEVFSGKFPHHIVASGNWIYQYLPEEIDYPNDLHLRALVVKKLDIIPVEFIWRSYLAGSLWKDYYSKGLSNPYGVELPPGLPKMARFASPIFTPTEKSEVEDPLDAEEVQHQYIGATTLSVAVYAVGMRHTHKCRIEIIDTKFEVGRDENNELYLADEFLTPDSSRYAFLSDVSGGTDPMWLDRQIFRDEAERQWGEGLIVPLEFSDEIIGQGVGTYQALFSELTGYKLRGFQEKYFE